MPQNALTGAANAGDDDNGAITSPLGGAKEAAKRNVRAVLRMTVQIKRSAKFEFSASHALFRAAIRRRSVRGALLFRRSRSGLCLALWNGIRWRPNICGGLVVLRERLTRLHSRGDAPP